jgi:bacterioferritin
MRHAEKVIERLLFLDAVPKMEYLPLNIGQSVREQLDADLKLELNAVGMYNKAVRASREAGDDISAELFKTLLADEERHVDWLESQMHLIKEIGYELYLASQMGGAAE